MQVQDDSIVVTIGSLYCRDPTEIGTYLTSVLCPVCKGVVHSNHCLSCGLPCTEVQQEELTRIASNISTALAASVSDSKCDSLRSGLESLKSVLSRNHYILARTRQDYILHAGNHILYLPLSSYLTVVVPGECPACRDHPCYLSSCLGILQLINTFQPGHTKTRLG